MRNNSDWSERDKWKKIGKWQVDIVKRLVSTQCNCYTVKKRIDKPLNRVDQELQSSITNLMIMLKGHSVEILIAFFDALG